VINPPFASNGETVVITATVHNFSNRSVDNVKVRFYQGDPGQGGQQIGSDQNIPTLPARDRKDVSVSWQASGTGLQRIYAVIDPHQQVTEVHDETTNPENNNNIAFGVLSMGDSGFVDPGAKVEFEYLSLTYADAQGLPTQVFIPPAALVETARFEMTPLPPTSAGMSTVTRRGFRLTAYQGGSDRDEPWNLTFGPAPAAVLLRYSEQDIAGLDENNLILYHNNQGTWEDAACRDYQRFPDENWMLVPICCTGDFALLGQGKGPAVYLPLILKSSQ